MLHLTGYGDGKNPLSYLEVKWLQPDATEYKYLSGNTTHGVSYSPSWTTTTTTPKPKPPPIKKFDPFEFGYDNFTTFTNIWNVTMNATDIEKDYPSKVTGKHVFET